MNYKKHYDLLMQKAKNRIVDKNVYTEAHHIIPRSEGGSNEDENLVKLYPREHFIAHWLLYRDSPTMSRGFAFNMMSCDRLGRYKPSSRAYAEGVEAAARAQSLNRKNKKTITKGSEMKYVLEQEFDYYLELGWTIGRKGRGVGKGRFWCNNGKEQKLVKQVPDGWNLGRLGNTTGGKTAIFKEGKVKYVRDTAQYLEEGWIIGNKKHNNPWKNFEGVSLKCPYCGKEGGYQGMKRNHFKNCKERV